MHAERASCVGNGLSSNDYAASSKPGISHRLAFASMVGTSLEWYDFMIYNTMAALIFGSVFFPSSDPIVGLLLAFSTYAVGYLSRPLGGMIFGRLGDVVGRRWVLVLALSLMGVSTGLIALLPSYHQIGLWSPALLVALRLLQGVALGGEWAGAVLLAVEHGGDDRRGINASWAQVGPAAGTLLASGIFGLLTASMSESSFLAWGWRVPFALSAVLVLFGLWLRVGIQETPVFEEMRRSDEVVKAPLGEVVRHHKRGLLIAGAARIGPDVIYALLVVFSLSYMKGILGLSQSAALLPIMVGAFLNIIAIPLFGLLVDRVGSRMTYGIGVISAIPLALVFFPILDTRSSIAAIGLIAVGMVIHAAMYSAQGSFIIEQFTPRVRYTGASIAYTFGSLAAGGAFAPLIMIWLLKEVRSTSAIAIYAVMALVATGAALAFARGPTTSPQD